MLPCALRLIENMVSFGEEHNMIYQGISLYLVYSLSNDFIIISL